MTDYVNGMFALREPPWHGKGTVVQEALTAAEAIKMATLDWTVGLYPVQIAGHHIPGKYATVREDLGVPAGVLGIVSERYMPVQNCDLFSFFDPVVEEGAAIYHTGGCLMGGRKVWLLAMVPEEYYVNGVSDDMLRSYILIASSHDGSLHVTIKHTPIRVVCWNTLSMALSHAATEYRIKHTKNAQYLLGQAHAVLGLATKRMALLTQAASKLASFQVTPAFVERFLRKVWPSIPEKFGGEPGAVIKNRRERIELMYSAQLCNTLEGMQGSAWALYNANAEYIDHEWGARKGTDALDRAWFGSGEELKLKAFRYLIEAANGHEA